MYSRRMIYFKHLQGFAALQIDSSPTVHPASAYILCARVETINKARIRQSNFPTKLAAAFDLEAVKVENSGR